MDILDGVAFMYPGLLAWLAMDALGKYVSSLFKMLVEKKDEHLVKEVCRYLQNILHSHVPNPLAEELKIRILRKFEDTYIEMGKRYGTQEEYHGIAVELFVAIVHESATSIECTKLYGHLDLLDAYRMRYVDVLYSALPRLKNLRVLRFYESIYISTPIEVHSFPSNLEEYSACKPSDGEVATLLDCCKKLKILNTYYPFDDWLTPLSHPQVLSGFEYLEEVRCRSKMPVNFLLPLGRLKRVCGKNASELIKNVAFCFHRFRAEQHCIEEFARHFPNLVSLTLNTVCHDLSPLKALNHLKQLSVDGISYVYVRTLLSSIGSQLTCLELCLQTDIDLEHVQKNCSSVTCLHLKEHYRESSFLLSNISIPKFPQVTRLEVDYVGFREGVKITNMLSAFINLKKLQINRWNRDILNALVKRDFTRSLEQVIIKHNLDFSLITLDFSEKYVVITESRFLRDKPVRVRSLPFPERL